MSIQLSALCLVQLKMTFIRVSWQAVTFFLFCLIVMLFGRPLLGLRLTLMDCSYRSNKRLITDG